MIDVPEANIGIPQWQQAIRDRCFHPTGAFVEYEKDWIYRSIPERFEQIVQACPDRVAVKDEFQELTYS